MADESTTGNTVPSPIPPQTPGQGTTPKPSEEKKDGIAETFSGLRVSLVPKDLTGQEDPDFKLRVLIAVMILILETGGILVGHYFINRTTEQREEQKIVLKQRVEEIGQEADEQAQDMHDALVFGSQLEVASLALDSHVYPTEAIDFLEANTLGGIKYDRVQLNLISGTVGIDVQAPNFRALAEQIVHLRSLDSVLQLRSSAATAKVDDFGLVAGVSATLVLSLDSKIWVGHKATLSLKQK